MENIKIDEPENDAIDTKPLITPQLEDQIESEIPIIPQSEDDTEVNIIKTEKEPITVNKIDVDDTEETKEAVDVKPQKLEESFTIFDFEPVLYFFKISPMVFDDRHFQDHAFGVIWLLFSKQQKKFPSIPQLHWCLKFLQELKDNDGIYTNDVNLCIQTVQDNLIKQYAKLGILLKYINKNEQKDKQLSEQELINIEENNILPQESVHNEPVVNKTEKSIIIIPKDIESLDDNKKFFNEDMSKNLIKSTNKNLNFQPCGTSCERKTILEKHVSKLISLTYTEMLSRGPLPCIEQINHKYNILLEAHTSFDSLKRFMEELNLSKESIATMNKKQLIKLFNDIRKKYVETIKKQVDKIYSLENFMKDIDKQSFKAYVTNDLIKRLKKLGDDDDENNM